MKKKNLTPKEIDEFRIVIQETGSLKYSQELAANFIQEALRAIKKIDCKNKEAKEFLVGIADYMLNREV